MIKPTLVLSLQTQTQTQTLTETDTVPSISSTNTMEASCLDIDNILNFNYDTCDEVVDANKQPLPLPTYPEEQEEELEWVSNFPPVDEFVLAGSEEKHHSPVSVLENSSSSSNNSNSNSNSGTVMSCCGSLRVPVRARSKHRRKRSFADIPSHQMWWNQQNAKSTRAAMRTSSTIGRKCQHCRAEKTPQWRAGPSGPKTLCNACGVRYKSGRLVDEYRPASSPTFLSQLHSNSHRKIIEMRRQKQVGTGMAAMDKG